MHANLGCQSYDWTMELCEAEQAHPRSCEVALPDAATDFACFVSTSEQKSLSTNTHTHSPMTLSVSSRYITEDVAYVSEFKDIDFERALGDDLITKMDKDDESGDTRGKRKGTRIYKCDGQVVGPIICASTKHPMQLYALLHMCTLAPYIVRDIFSYTYFLSFYYMCLYY